MDPEFIKQQFFITVRAYFPECTFKEHYAPDYAEYAYSVFNNGKYICTALWYVWHYPSGPVLQSDLENNKSVFVKYWNDLGKWLRRIQCQQELYLFYMHSRVSV